MVIRVERPASPIIIERDGDAYGIIQGDTLGRISRKVYGNNTKWRLIWRNNKQMIRNPHLIYAGFTLYYVPPSELKGRRMASKPVTAPSTGGPESAEPTETN